MIFLLLFLILLPGCREMTDRKPIANKIMSEKDIHKLLEQVDQKQRPPLPRKQFKKKKPLYHKNFYKKVSASITEQTPLKDFLTELARKNGINLSMAVNIEKKVVYTAHQKTFIEIIYDLADLLDLRYTVRGQNIKIQNDAPYTKTYNVQFLNLSRESDNKIATATDIFSSSPHGKKAVLDNGSNTTVKMKGKNNFWEELEHNLKILLSGSKGTKYSFHKQGGVVSVLGTFKDHKLVGRYLSKLKKVTTAQVLIEAKIVEVNLSDQFKSGIDWEKVGTHNDLRLQAPFGQAIDEGTSDLITLGGAGSTFKGLLKVLEKFGSSRTLSSPRLTVMNNQNAVLKVAKNEVYFRVHYDKHYSSRVDRETVSVSSDIQTIPLGLIMTVQPSINLDTNEVVLYLRPSISKLSKTVDDPAVAIAFNAASNNNDTAAKLPPSKIPVVEVREIDSVLQLSDGETAVLGGLMKNVSHSEQNKIPGLGDMIFVKNAFSSQSEGDEVVELVILLKVRILQKNDETVTGADRRLLDDYMADPRRF